MFNNQNTGGIFNNQQQQQNQGNMNFNQNMNSVNSLFNPQQSWPTPQINYGANLKRIKY